MSKELVQELNEILGVAEVLTTENEKYEKWS